MDQVIDKVNKGVKTLRQVFNEVCFSIVISNIEPINVNKALSDEFCIATIQEELKQFERDQVWD